MSDEANENGAKEEFQVVPEKAEATESGEKRTTVPTAEQNEVMPLSASRKVLGCCVFIKKLGQWFRDNALKALLLPLVVALITLYISKYIERGEKTAEAIRIAEAQEKLRKEWDGCKESLVWLRNDADEAIATGFLVSQGDATYVYTSRHAIMADTSEEPRVRTDIHAFIGLDKNETKLRRCEILSGSKDNRLLPWQDIARYQVVTTNKAFSIGRRDELRVGRSVSLLAVDKGGMRVKEDGVIRRSEINDIYFTYTMEHKIDAEGLSGGAVCIAPGVVVGVHSCEPKKSSNDPLYYSFIIDDDGGKWEVVTRGVSYEEYLKNLLAVPNLDKRNWQQRGLCWTDDGMLAHRKDETTWYIFNVDVHTTSPEEYKCKKIETLRKRANNNCDAVAQVSLGFEYLIGGQVETDHKEAVRLFEMAAMSGDDDAERLLGDCYYHGYGVVTNGDSALEWYTKSATKGNCHGMFGLGNCYRWGVGADIDGLEAFKWYKAAADGGSVAARTSLGDCYWLGIGVAADQREAFKCYMMSAEQGDPYAQVRIGEFYANGTGMDKNAEEAFKWFKMAAEKDYGIGQMHLGECYAKGIGVEVDEKEAFKWFEVSAENGSDYGELFLGDCYMYGRGVEKNEVKAASLYRDSAEHGNLIGQYRVGTCYFAGSGVEKNVEDALAWLHCAAENGNLDAQIFLGRIYGIGLEVSPNAAESDKWITMAARGGNKDAQMIIGANALFGKDDSVGFVENVEQTIKRLDAKGGYAVQIFKDLCVRAERLGESKVRSEWVKEGWGYLRRLGEDDDNMFAQMALGIAGYARYLVDNNDTRFIKWLQMAANNGSVDSMIMLAECYLDSQGVKKDCNMAFSLYKKAAMQGNAEAQAALGDCYLDAIGVAKDAKEAFKWYKASAEQGNPVGLLHLGECFAQGEGVAKDQAKAFENFKRAAEQNVPRAYFTLGWCYENGFGVEKNLEEAKRWYDKVGDTPIEVSKEDLNKDFLSLQSSQAK